MSMIKTREYVYLLACPETQLTKIGWSRDPEKRFSQLQAESAFPLLSEHAYILMCPTGFGSYFESLLHKYFAHRRAFGEWFKLTQEDLEFFRGPVVLRISLEHSVGYDPEDPCVTRLLAKPNEELTERERSFIPRLPIMQSDHYV